MLSESDTPTIVLEKPHTEGPVAGAEQQPKSNLTVCSEQGTYREYQEDRIVTESIEVGGKKVQVLAVMDGHGGAGVSEQLAKHLIPAIQHMSGEEFSGGDFRVALSKSIQYLSFRLKRAVDGSTLSVVLVPEGEDKAYVAVIGDSPVIIKDTKGHMVFSPEHNIRTNEEERQAALARGALIIPVEGSDYMGTPHSNKLLQLSRSIGDKSLAGVVSSEPDLYNVELGPDSFIVVASDGVLDRNHTRNTDNLLDIAQKVGQGASAQELVHDALAGGSRDNVSAIVWHNNQTLSP